MRRSDLNFIAVASAKITALIAAEMLEQMVRVLRR